MKWSLDALEISADGFEKHHLTFHCLGSDQEAAWKLHSCSKGNPPENPTQGLQLIFGSYDAGDGTLTSFVGVGPATPRTLGGWTLLSTDTGNTMIHATPLSNGQVLILERPGNREAPVSFCHCLRTLHLQTES